MPWGGLTVNDRMTIIRVQPCPDTGKKGEADMFIPELKTEIMDRVKACYRKHGDAIEEFLSEAYEIVRKEYETSGID